jgi:hypothetical protein
MRHSAPCFQCRSGYKAESTRPRFLHVAVANLWVVACYHLPTTPLSSRNPVNPSYFRSIRYDIDGDKYACYCFIMPFRGYRHGSDSSAGQQRGLRGFHRRDITNDGKSTSILASCRRSSRQTGKTAPMWIHRSWGDVVSFLPNHAMGITTNQPEAHKTPNGLGGATSKSPLACLYGLRMTWLLMTPWLDLSLECLWRIAATAELLKVRLENMGYIHRTSNCDRPQVARTSVQPLCIGLNPEKEWFMGRSAIGRNMAVI